MSGSNVEEKMAELGTRVSEAVQPHLAIIVDLLSDTIKEVVSELDGGIAEKAYIARMVADQLAKAVFAEVMANISDPAEMVELMLLMMQSETGEKEQVTGTIH